MARFTLNRKETLKSRTAISELFSVQNKLARYPNLAFWNAIPYEDSKNPILFAVSVPKRNFKKATDRNLLKRRIREAYRLNKHMLSANFSDQNQIHVIFVYTAREILPYSEIESSIIYILRKLNHKLLK